MFFMGKLTIWTGLCSSSHMAIFFLLKSESPVEQRRVTTSHGFHASKMDWVVQDFIISRARMAPQDLQVYTGGWIEIYPGCVRSKNDAPEDTGTYSRTYLHGDGQNLAMMYRCLLLETFLGCLSKTCFIAARRTSLFAMNIFGAFFMESEVLSMPFVSAVGPNGRLTWQQRCLCQ